MRFNVLVNTYVVQETGYSNYDLHGMGAAGKELSVCWKWQFQHSGISK